MPLTDPPRKAPKDGRPFLDGTRGELPATAPLPAPEFVVTKEHRRFTEFADTVRQYRYIGVCFGPPGVGETLSARHYAGTDDLHRWQGHLETAGRDPDPLPDTVRHAATALYTPTVAANTRELTHALPNACQQISYALDYADHGTVDPFTYTDSRASGRTELLIIDEADRLNTPGLEHVRDYYDRHHLGVILIGMPGIEKRLARYPQLYSRIGFAHQYRPLGSDELTAVLRHRWPTSQTDKADDLTRDVAIATIARITAGNFRLVDRLLAQVERIQQINRLDTVTTEVVEAAREALLIGN